MDFRRLLAIAIVFSFFANAAHAGFFGQYGYGLEIRANGVSTLYGLNASGPALLPTGSSATYDGSSWANGSELSPVLNLGSFNPGAGDTLLLKGGSELLFADVGSGGFVSGGDINYRVFPGTGAAAAAAAPAFITGIAMPIDASLGGNNARVAVQGLNINLLAGLSPGTYTLGSYGFGYGNSDATTAASAFANNQSGNYANYGARFTVVPEPSIATIAGVGCLVVLLRRETKRGRR